MNKKLRLGFVFLIALALSSFPTPAYACTEPVGGLPHYSVTKHVLASDIVVEGVVFKTEGEWYPEIATIEVYQYIKGSGPAIIQVLGYFPSSMCGTDVRVDMHAIFYIRADESGTFRPMQLGQFDAAIEASPENVSEAIAASGQDSILVQQSEVYAALTAIAAVTPPTSTPTHVPSELESPTPAPPTPVPGEYPIITLVVTPFSATSMVTSTFIPNPTPTPTSAWSSGKTATVTCFGFGLLFGLFVFFLFLRQNRGR